jgi:ATP phosphoribosyltransferase
MKETITILTLSKGRMKAEAEKVFKKKKLKIIRESERSLIGSIKGYPNIRVLYMNATEIVEALGKEIGDIGISGKDLWLESDQSIQSNIALAKQYNWGKSDLIVAVDTMWIDCVNPTDLEDISYEFYQKKKRLMRCATKFKNLAHSWFNSKGITQYELISSLGATEAANKLTADLIVDLSTTGETLRQNNLKVIDTILSSSACLFYAKKSIKKKGVKKIIKLIYKY